MREAMETLSACDRGDAHCLTWNYALLNVSDPLLDSPVKQDCALPRIEPLSPLEFSEHEQKKMKQRDESIPWSKASTLEQYVIKLIESKQTKSEEFKFLLDFFGRDKLEKIWKSYKAQKK